MSEAFSEKLRQSFIKFVVASFECEKFRLAVVSFVMQVMKFSLRVCVALFLLTLNMKRKRKISVGEIEYITRLCIFHYKFSLLDIRDYL